MIKTARSSVFRLWQEKSNRVKDACISLKEIVEMQIRDKKKENGGENFECMSRVGMGIQAESSRSVSRM